MRITIDIDGNITAHGDTLTDEGVIAFPANEAHDNRFPTGWTVEGEPGQRQLLSPEGQCTRSSPATRATTPTSPRLESSAAVDGPNQERLHFEIDNEARLNAIVADGKVSNWNEP